MNEHCRGCIRYLKSCSGMTKAVCEKHKLRIPRTKADLIRAMTDEELAELLYAHKCVDCILFSHDCKVEETLGSGKTCDERILDWLREEAEKSECDCKEIFENTADCPCDNCEKMKE